MAAYLDVDRTGWISPLTLDELEVNYVPLQSYQPPLDSRAILEMAGQSAFKMQRIGEEEGKENPKLKKIHIKELKISLQDIFLPISYMIF